jgi:hypothetical protein
MHHLLNKGKENHYICIILLLCTLGTKERRIITNGVILIFFVGNQGKENHYKCIILHLCTLGTRERRIITNAPSFSLNSGNQGTENHYKCAILFFKLWEPGKGESL